MSRPADIQAIRQMAQDRQAKYGIADELAKVLLRMATKLEQPKPHRPPVDDAWEE